MDNRVVHLGEILKEELGPKCVFLMAAACQIDMPANRTGQITTGKRSITTDTAIRLGR